MEYNSLVDESKRQNILFVVTHSILEMKDSGKEYARSRPKLFDDDVFTG